MRTGVIIALIGGVLVALGVFTQDSPDEARDENESDRAEFETYTNERFSYSVAYPTDVFTEIDQSENNDGAVFSSDDRDAELRVFARHNVLDETILDVFPEAREDFASIESEEGRQVYAVLRGVGNDGNRRVERFELVNEAIYFLELSYSEDALDEDVVDEIISSHEIEIDPAP